MGAHGERVVGEALELLEGVRAFGAGVLVGRHGSPSVSNRPGGAGTLPGRLPMVRHNDNHHDVDRIPRTGPPGSSFSTGLGLPAGRRTSSSWSCWPSSRRPRRRWSWCAGRSPRSTAPRSLPGLTGEVEVVRDDHGIPQLYADSLADLMAAQGYVHAQERFYEMDVRRHITAGRLSELFGKDTLETDEFVRTLGWRDVAEQELPLLEARDPRGARGVRRRGERLSRLAQSFADRGRVLRPRARRPRLPPRALDAGRLAGLAQGDGLGPQGQHGGGDRARPGARPTTLPSRWPTCSRRTTTGPRADRRPGGGRRRGLRAGRRRRAAPATPSDRRTPPPSAGSCARLHDTLQRLPVLVGRGDGVGSNSWVVDGEHSATGQPLLANDPHLGVGVPGVWMQVGLHCRTVSAECPLDVAGFSFSGVPGVVIGHNADIAWGFTNLGPDVTDLYLERVRGDSWLQNGQPHPLIERQETIKVRGEDDVTITVRATSHGPILSDVGDFYPDLAEDAPDDPSGAGPPPRTTSSLPSRWLGRRCSPPPRPTRSSASTWLTTGPASARPRRPSPCRRRTSCTPTARVTSATRLPAWCRSASRATTGCSPRRAGAVRTTGPATTCRTTGCPTCWTPTRASSPRPTRRWSGRTIPTT